MADKPSASVEASLFYVKGSRWEDDPPIVRNRAAVIYGEALLREEELPVRANIHQEKEKLWRLDWHGSTSAFRTLLQEPHWDHPAGNLRFSLGLSRRPPVLAIPFGSLQAARYDAGSCPPAATGSLVEPFVCTEKEQLAASVVESCGSQDLVAAALARLKYLTGRDFRGGAEPMFGDVYIVSNRRLGDDPVRWHTIIDGDGRASRLRVEIDESSVGESLTINLRVYGSDLVVLEDFVFSWQKGLPCERSFTFNQDIGGAWLRAWDAQGRLLAEDANGLIRQIPLAVMFSGTPVHVDDRLTAATRKAVQSGTATQAMLGRVSRVSRGMAVRTIISAPDEAPWSMVRLSAAAAVHRHIRATFDEEAYYPAGAEGRAMAMLSLAEKIAAASEGATFIDPFFDVEGGVPLLLRVGRVEVPLTVVTWLQEAKSVAATSLREQLEQILPEHLTPPRLEVFQLSGKKQPFHDRYLLIETSDGPTVYVLTNSLSGMAKDYPLVVSKVSGGTAWAIRDEIEKIVRESREKGERLTPERPDGKEAVANRIKSHTFFPGWKILLRLLVEALDDSDSAWVDAACDAGLMRRDESGPQWQLQGPHEDRIRTSLYDALSRGPSQLGHVLCVLGQVSARGVRVEVGEATEIVKKAYDAGRAVQALVEHLRERFIQPETKRGRSFAEQCFVSELTYDLAAAAFIGWNGDRYLPELRSFERDWGRELSFMVLSRLDPKAAIALSDELHDLTLVVVGTGLFRDRLGAFGQVAEAMQTARSAFLRAFGTQARAVSRTRAHHANHLIAPDDVHKSSEDLRATHCRSSELVTYLALWARSNDEERRPALVEELLAELAKPTSDDVTQQQALLSCLNYAHPVVLGIFEQLDKVPPDAALRLCRALLSVLPTWLPVSEGERSKRSFHRSDLPLCQTIANAAGRVARETGTSVAEVIHDAMASSSFDKLLVPVSPLGPRPGRVPAVNAFGWIAVCSLMANERAEALEKEQLEAKRLLESYGEDLDDDLRSVLGELVNGTAVRATGTPTSHSSS